MRYTLPAVLYFVGFIVQAHYFDPPGYVWTRNTISDPRLTSDAHSATWQLFAENALRILVFAIPLLIPLQLHDGLSRVGLVLYILGTLIYFTSWLPLLYAPNSAWSQSAVGALAPFLTPLAIFWGVALIGSSWGYGLVSSGFIGFHAWHGLQNLKVV